MDQNDFSDLQIRNNRCKLVWNVKMIGNSFLLRLQTESNLKFNRNLNVHVTFQFNYTTLLLHIYTWTEK